VEEFTDWALEKITGLDLVIVVVFDAENGLDAVEFIEDQARTAAKPVASKTKLSIVVGPRWQTSASRQALLLAEL
jgi:hypothetical protein